jgi:hypothetical protein
MYVNRRKNWIANESLANLSPECEECLRSRIASSPAGKPPEAIIMAIIG